MRTKYNVTNIIDFSRKKNYFEEECIGNEYLILLEFINQLVFDLV